ERRADRRRRPRYGHQRQDDDFAADNELAGGSWEARGGEPFRGQSDLWRHGGRRGGRRVGRPAAGGLGRLRDRRGDAAGGGAGDLPRGRAGRQSLQGPARPARGAGAAGADDPARAPSSAHGPATPSHRRRRGRHAVLSADDPRVGEIGLTLARPPVWYGLEDRRVAAAGLPHAADARTCPRCGTSLRFEVVYYGHEGVYECPNGDFARPEPNLTAQNVELEGLDAVRLVLAGTA